jgi:hypothetical protein
MTDVALLRKLFFYQSSHHAEQWRAADGRVGYSPACDNRFSEACKLQEFRCASCPHRAPTRLTDERLEEHLKGRLTLGAYQLREDGTAGWLCLDVDADEDSDHARANVKRLTSLLAAKCAQIGLPVAVEFTGNKGFHLWAFIPDGAPAGDLRRLGLWIVDGVLEAEGEPGDLHVEVFPKQDTLDANDPYGNLVKVPLSRHKKTGNRCVFVDSDWKPYPDQIEYLASVEMVTADTIAAILEEWVPEAPEKPKSAALAPGKGRLAKATREFMAHGAGEGERNDRLFKAAADMAGNGYAEMEVVSALLDTAMQSGLDEKEALATIESACSKARNPSVPATIEESDHYERTDGGIVFMRAKPVYARGGRIGTDWIPTQVTNFTAEFAREIVEKDGDEYISLYQIIGQAPDRRFAAEIDGEAFRDERKCRGVIGAAAGAKAIIYSQRHLPLAIQSLSNGFAVETHYLSTGWQTVEGELAFLTPGAAPELCDVDAECRRYDVRPGDIAKGLDALLNGLIEAFAHEVTYPAVAHAFLAPLFRWIRSAKRYALHLVGETGSLKTSYACALLSLYGPEFTSEEPTEKWSSTWKKIEVLGHQAKDVLFLVDDYKPRYTRPADVTALIQNYSESRGRGRLNRNATIQGTKWIRGALIMTGEDIPENESSVISRMLILKLVRPVGANEALSHAQDNSAHLNAVIDAYTHWLAQIMPGTEGQVEAWLTEWRDHYIALCPRSATNPGRIASNIAQNRFAFHTMGQFLIERGAWASADFDARMVEYDAIAEALVIEMAERVGNEKASNSYLTAIRALIESGEMQLLDKARLEPDSSGAFLGWQDDEFIYLLPDVAYQAAERWHRAMGGSLGFTRRAVEEQLIDDGAIETSDEAGRRRTTRVLRIGTQNSKTKLVRVLKLYRWALDMAGEEAPTQDEIPF